MWEFLAQNPAAWVLLPFVPVVVYFVARLIFIAYFHAKRDHLRRLYRGIDPKENDRVTRTK